MWRIMFLTVLAVILLPRTGQAVVSVYENESNFISDLTGFGYTDFAEDFESAAWDHVRSSFPNHNVAPSVTHQGITWQPRPGNAITTNMNWGRTGWGIYEFQNSPLSSSQILGSSVRTLFGVGGWVNTNPDGGEFVIEIDGVSHDGTPVGSGHAFYGVIDTEGFTSFRVYDLEGETVWGADDFSFAISQPECDFDGDAECRLSDIDALITDIAGSNHDLLYDLTRDGAVDLDDRDQWLAQAGDQHLASGNPYLVADFNLDGVVDGQDFLEWNSHKFTRTATWSAGDANADGVTDGQDFLEWNANKFTSSDGVSAVPEPGIATLLFALVLAGVRAGVPRGVCRKVRPWS